MEPGWLVQAPGWRFAETQSARQLMPTKDVPSWSWVGFELSTWPMGTHFPWRPLAVSEAGDRI